MKLNGNKSFITDNDIIVTNISNYGKSLGSVLDKQSQDIQTLKGNVKWIYQNGSIGGGSFVGSGSSDSSNWGLFASLNGTQIKNGTVIALNGAKYYTLTTSISKTGGKPYNITIKYYTEDGPEQITKTLSMETGYDFETKILLNINDTISITASDSDNVKQSVSAQYITEPYKFDVYLAKNDNTRWEEVDNDILIDRANLYGLQVNILYDIAVPGTYTYEFLDIYGNSGGIHEFNLNSDTKILSLPIANGISITNALAGLHNINVTINIDPETGLSFSENYNLRFNLIPNELYLKVLPEMEGSQLYSDLGDIEDNRSWEQIKNNVDLTNKELPLVQKLTDVSNSRYNYKEGLLSIIVQPYCGQPLERTFDMSITIDGKPISIDYPKVKERKCYTIAIPTGIPSILPHKLSITLQNGIEKPTFDYYYYVGEGNTSMTWYETIFTGMDDAITNNVYNNFYRSIGNNESARPNDRKTTEAFSNYENTLYIKQTANSQEIIIYGEKNTPQQINVPTNINDVMFSFGIQYSSINDVSQEIISIELDTHGAESNYLHIFQNKIILGTDNSIDIYIPKEKDYNPTITSKYHLVTIYKRYVSQYKYELIVYIDGVIENAFASYITTEAGYNRIKIKPGNYAINLLELSFFPHNDKTANIRTTVKKPGTDETMISTLNWFDDVNIVRYFYKYCLDMGDDSKYTDEKGSELEYYRMFKELGMDENNMITANDTLISNIAKNSKIPTIYFKLKDSELNVKNQNTFVEWFNAQYEEHELPEAPSKDVDVFYTEGNGNDLQKIKIPHCIANTTKFRISLQGSSTGEFRSKNLDLEIISSDVQYTAVYSPNLLLTTDNDTEAQKTKCYNTFLPEQLFTLKADVVDSAHANNTTIGRFVNEHTTKFNTKQKSVKYKDYIKNCLLGFPVQVFIEVETPVLDEDGNATGENKLKHYYLGIYNFNLGRDSWHNLGYVDLDNSFDNILNAQENKDGELVLSNKEGLLNGFNVYAITKTITKQPGLLVAEIAGGSEYYDFSQFDKSILFNLETNPYDNGGMFGDLVGSSSAITGEEKTIIQEFVKTIARAGAHIYTNIGKNFGPITEGYHKAVDDEHPLDSINQVPDWRVQYVRSLDGDTNVYTPFEWGKGPNNTILTDININDLIRAVKGGTTEDDADVKPFINYVSLVEYYTICMVMGLVDSVQKNLNIKSWTADQKYKNNSNATFYVAFYDMDTALGIDNAGNPVTYFAFSDYWKSMSSSNGNTFTPEPITIYRDFFPNKTACTNLGIDLPIGYDIPASYLFALAKYAKIFDKSFSGNDGDDTVLDLGINANSFPGNLYASWRQIGGPLENSEKFVKTYFAANLNNISECALNFNYRFKYFIKTSTGFESYNNQSFNGKRVYSLIEWFNGRLHILDAYFNINQVPSNFKTFNKTTKTWDEFKVNGVPVPEYVPLSNFIKQTNKDITVLTDIFATETSSGKKYSSSIDVTIKGEELTPMIITGPQTPIRYLLEDSTKIYKLYIPVTGNEYFRFGGSSDWRYINNISSFIAQDQVFNISSDKLDTLTGTFGHCKQWVINLPAMKTLSLTSPNYSDTITLHEANKYPNIKDIIIDNSKLSLDLNNIPVQTISANSVNSNNISIINCPNINTLSLNNATIVNLTIAPIWTNNIIINNSWGNITTINLTGKESEEFTVEITNNTGLTSLSITGRCTSIIIKDCPNLNKLTIAQDPKDNEYYIETLKITNCNTTNLASFKVNSEIPGHVKLTSLNKLKTISFNKTLNINCIDLPEVAINIPKDILASTGIQYINTTPNTESAVVITGNSTFNNLTKFRPILGQYNTTTGKFEPKLDADNNVQHINLKINDNVTDLSGTFTSCTTLTSDDAKWFLHTICNKLNSQTGKPIANQITNIARIFEWDGNVTYSDNEFIEDYKNKTFKYSLQKFINVTDISYAFFGCGFCKALHRYMLTGIGSQSCLNVSDGIYRGVANKLNAASFVSINKITSDALYDILPYMLAFPWNTPPNNVAGLINISVIDDSAFTQQGDNLELKTVPTETTIYLEQILNNIDKYDSGGKAHMYIYNGPNDLTTIYHDNNIDGFYPVSLQYFDNFNFTNNVIYTNLFVNKNGVEYDIRRIYYSLGGSTPMSDVENTLNDIGIQNLSKLSIINNSLNFNNPNSVLQLSSLLPIAIISNIMGESTDKGDVKFNGNCMNCNKYIHINNLKRIFDKAAEKSQTVKGINNLFKNCIVGIPSIADNELNITVTKNNVHQVLTYCKTAKHLFDNMCFVVKPNETDTCYQTIPDNQKIPISLTQNSTLLLQNCTDYSYTFSNLIISENLPFNFFNKRSLCTQNTVYLREYDTTNICYYYDTVATQVDTTIDEFGNMIPVYEYTEVKTTETYFYSTSHAATKYSYEYVRDVTNLTGCFANTIIANSDNCYCFDLSSVISSNGTIKNNIPCDYIVRNDNGQIYKYTSTPIKYTVRDYAANDKNIQFAYLTENTEISDCRNIQGLHHNQVNLIKPDGTEYMKDVNNFYIANDVLNTTINSLLLPPDILYCTADNANIENMFDNFNGIGVLPKNLLKKCKTSRLTNTFRNNFVIPQYWCSYDNDDYNTTDVYVYIPESFTNAENLNYAFNFKFNMPQGSHLYNQLVNGQKYKHEQLLIFVDNSIGTSVSSMEYGLPQYYRSLLNSSCTTATNQLTGKLYNLYDFGIRFNIMGQKIMITTGDGVSTITGLKLGLDMSKYTKLYNNMSNLIPTQMMQLINGHVFNSDFNIAGALAKTGYIMTVKPINASNTQIDSFDERLGVWASISKNIILPAHYPANTKAIYIEQYADATLLLTSNVVDSEQSKNNYSNNVMGGNGSITWN